MANGSDMVMKRVISLWSGIAIVIGCIIGSGIFVSPKGVLQHSGSVGLSLVIWSLCGVVSLLGALSFAELGTLITKSGGMYAYLQAAFGNLVGFLYLWATLIIILPTVTAIVGLICGKYLLTPLFPDCQYPDIAARLIAVIAICFLTVMNCAKVEYGAKIQNIFTIIKMLALVLIIVSGIAKMCMGEVGNFKNSFQGSSKYPGEIALAFYSGLFSYGGWYTLNFLTEELKNPKRDLPRAIIFGITTVTLVYILTNLAYFSILNPSELLASDAVAMDYSKKILSKSEIVMSIFVACSTFGSLNGGLLGSSRVYCIGARDGLLPSFLSYLHIDRKTPMPAIMLQAILSIIMLFAGDIFVLIHYVMFMEAVTYLGTILALFYLRKKMPDAPRAIKVHLIIPAVFLIFCIFLVVVPIIMEPKTVINSLLVLVVGIPVYFLGVTWKSKPKFYYKKMAEFTMFVQKLFLIGPQFTEQKENVSMHNDYVDEKDK